MGHAIAASDAGRVAEKSRQGLILGALGVVYGDIGTSPLYTVKQCFDSIGTMTPSVVYGVLSLIAWALFIVVTVKYVIVIMRTDNRGEGGILALTALALRTASRTGRRHRWILCAGLVGAALFYGDGVITPAISVLSAVEGLKVATHVFEECDVPPPTMSEVEVRTDDHELGVQAADEDLAHEVLGRFHRARLIEVDDERVADAGAFEQFELLFEVGEQTRGRLRPHDAGRVTVEGDDRRLITALYGEPLHCRNDLAMTPVHTVIRADGDDRALLGTGALVEIAQRPHCCGG